MVSTTCTHARTLCGTHVIPTQRFICKQPGWYQVKSLNISPSFSCKQSEVRFA